MMSYRPGWFSPHVKVLQLEMGIPTSSQVSEVALVLVLVNVTGPVIVVRTESAPGVKLALTPQLFSGCAVFCCRMRGAGTRSVWPGVAALSVERKAGREGLVSFRCCFCHCMACHSTESYI